MTTDGTKTPIDVTLPSLLSGLGDGVLGSVVRVATSAAQALIDAIAEGDVPAVEQLSRVLPEEDQIEARAAALKARQAKKAADTLPP